MNAPVEPRVERREGKVRESSWRRGAVSVVVKEGRSRGLGVLELGGRKVEERGVERDVEGGEGLGEGKGEKYSGPETDSAECETHALLAVRCWEDFCTICWMVSQPVPTTPSH